MSPFEILRSALRALLTNRLRAVLTMLGILIGVAAVILLVSVGEGARRYVTRQFNDLGTNLVIILPGKSETTGGTPVTGAHAYNPLILRDATELARRGRHFNLVAPIVMASAPVKYRDRSRDVSILGVTYEAQEARNLHVEIGHFIPKETIPTARRLCVLGRKVKMELFGNQSPLGRKVKIAGATFRVIGIMETKGESLGFDIDDLVFIPIRSAQNVFHSENLFEILIQARSADRVEPAIAEARAILKQRHDDTEDVTLISQDAMLKTFQTILGALTYGLAAIAGISLLVGGVGVMNIMLVSVKERTREVGVRKAVGATDGAILGQFLVEALVLSLLGGAAGIGFGVGVADLCGRVWPSLPLSVPGWSVAAAFLSAFFIGLFFGVYPAFKAARLNPIEALRYE